MERAHKEKMNARKCYEKNCKGIMQGVVGAYRYKECGLDNITLRNITVYTCGNCGAVVPEIPAIGDLHRGIALSLIHKQTQLTGTEIRFLRKMAGMTPKDMSDALGVHPTSLCKWETGERKPAKKTDASVRLIALAGMLQDMLKERDIVPAVSKAAKELSEVDIKTILAGIKKGQAKPVKMNIDPNVLSGLGSFSDPGDVPGTVQ
jgi:DNA-binding transcriptional regulator YiaG